MFNKVVIIGTGLLGGSLGIDLKVRQLAKQVVGVCRSEDTARLAMEKGVVDRCDTLESAVQGAELIVLATPMQAMLPIFRQLETCVEPHTIITDVGSVKTSLYKQVAEHVPGVLRQCVFAHPIAGGEHSGVQAARGGLFKNKHVIITNTPESVAANTLKVTRMWQDLECRVLELGLEEHDAIFAKTSHLPHVIAFTLVNYLSQQTDRQQLFDLAAAGFYDFTRIASSDAQMWRDICITNKDQVLDALRGFKQQIEAIESKVESAEQEGILTYFEAAKQARDSGLLNKARSVLDDT